MALREKLQRAISKKQAENSRRRSHGASAAFRAGEKWRFRPN
jgi:hypothetical protein